MLYFVGHVLLRRFTLKPKTTENERGSFYEVLMTDTYPALEYIINSD